MPMVVQARKTEAAAFHGFTGNALKLIAILSMVIQHVTIKFMSGNSPDYYLFLSLGKITAPVMCFFIAEGFHYSRNRIRYLRRLFFFALLSHIPYTVAFGFPIWQFWKYTSVMWSLALGLAALMIYDHKEWNRTWRVLGILLCCILSYPGNWNCVAVIWILGFGIFRDEPRKKWLVFGLGVLVNIVEFFVIENDSFLLSNLAFILPVWLLSQYNGRRGKSSRFIQQFFYWFYPIHLMILFLM